MKVEIINSKEVWDSYPNIFFLQTWQWGDFEEKGLGRKVWRLAFKEGENIVGLCLAVEEIGRFGKFVYCPRGPVLDWENKEKANLALNALVEFFKDKGVLFLRMDPSIKEDVLDFKKLGFRDAAYFVQPERVWMLDLQDKSEDELIRGMRQKGRYLKKAIKSDLEVGISKDRKEFDVFLNMLQELAKRKGFHAVSSSYLLKQFEMLGDVMKFICVKQEGKIIAGGWFAFFGEESSYLHGASSEEVGGSRAPYLVQWEAIKHAKELGLKRHNFWGVVEDKNYHPGYAGFGFSSFKKGFGGYMEEYMRAKDFVYNVVKYQPVRLNELYRNFRDRSN